MLHQCNFFVTLQVVRNSDDKLYRSQFSYEENKFFQNEFFFVCVRACVWARARARSRVCVRARACVCVRARA